MTTNKPGTVNQQPLFGCTSCYEDYSWTACDLRVHDGECWCELCWDERRWDFPDQPYWTDLAPFKPAPAVQGEPVAFDEDVALTLAEREFYTEIDEQLASDIIRYARKLRTLYAAPQPAEQQPISHDWDDQDRCRRCGDRDWYASATCRPKQQPALTKYQPCGCVICTCEHETQCQGCGAKHCGTHPVGQIPGPVYQQPSPDVSALVEALERIASWPDGGNQSGQPHIKMFAAKALAAHRKQEPGHD